MARPGPATARRELTISLTALTRSPGDYLDRAYAAARLGDTVRARLDFELASKYDSGFVAKYKTSVEQEIASNRVDGNPGQMLAALEQKARSGVPLESLIPEAVALHKAMAPRRRRYDGWYQERMRQLEEAVRAAPKSAAPYVNSSGAKKAQVFGIRTLVFIAPKDNRQEVAGLHLG